MGGELSLSSGAELLAATRAAGTQHLAAARSRLAGEEAVPACANEVARLKSALHRTGPEFNEKGRPLLGRPSIRCGRLEESQAQVKVGEPRRGLWRSCPVNQRRRRLGYGRPHAVSRHVG